MNSEQRVGLTPMLMRAAINFLNQGVGRYPTDTLGYDVVEVRVLRRWERRLEGSAGEAYSQETQVSFYRAGRRERWVDFVIRISGAGGSPVISVLPGRVEGEEE